MGKGVWDSVDLLDRISTRFSVLHPVQCHVRSIHVCENGDINPHQDD